MSYTWISSRRDHVDDAVVALTATRSVDTGGIGSGNGTGHPATHGACSVRNARPWYCILIQAVSRPFNRPGSGAKTRARNLGLRSDLHAGLPAQAAGHPLDPSFVPAHPGVECASRTITVAHARTNSASA